VISVADLNVRPYLRLSENTAGIQSLITTTKGDYMENRAIVLAVWKGTPPEGYEANATSTIGTPGTPVTPSGEPSSRFTLNSTNGRIEVTHLVADGGAVQVYIPEGAVITEGTGSLVQALTLQRLLPGDAGGADPAYAVGSEDMVSDLPLRLVISVSKPGGVIARYDRSSGTWQTLETTADAAGSVSAKIRQGGVYAVRYGETDGSTPGGLFGLLLGAVQALFSLFGFVSAGEEVGTALAAEPTPDPRSTVEPTPAAAPAVDITTMRFDLSVHSDPPGALIDLDGEYTGRTTPAAFESLSGGTHTVRVRMDGAEPVEREILLERDDEVVVEVSGGASPGLLRTWEQNHYGGVYVDSLPDGATIFVDGRKVNRKTPAVIYGLKEGLHTIKVKKEATAFSSDKERVWIERNVMSRVTFTSGNAELTRSLTFESEEYAQKPFSINGRYLGDRLPKTVEVRGIGGAYITVYDGESYQTHKIPTHAQSNDTVKAAFSDAPCSLLVTSVPSGAAISVDGFQTGFSTPYVVE